MNVSFKEKMVRFFVIVFFLSLSSCVTTGLYSDLGAAIVKVDTKSGSLSFHKGVSSSYGESCSYNILGIFTFGDSGLNASKREGNLRTIAYTDTSMMNILGLFGRVCTKAYGKK